MSDVRTFPTSTTRVAPQGMSETLMVPVLCIKG